METVNQDIGHLKKIFAAGSMTVNGETLTFEGELGKYEQDIPDLQQAIGYGNDKGILAFLGIFGGTRLFVSRFGTGTTIFPAGEIVARSLEVNTQIEMSFYPKFIWIGHDAPGDMLCLYKDENSEIHFGNLHHEALGGDPEEMIEGFTPAYFGNWLQMFIKTAGCTLPDKTCVYTIAATIEYILPEKAHLYLKLGRKLAVFVKTGSWFESKTFEWISFRKHDAVYVATYVKSIDQGNDHFNNVLSFETVNERYDEADLLEHEFTGNMNECLSWIKVKCATEKLLFMKPEELKIIYTGLTKKGIPGG